MGSYLILAPNFTFGHQNTPVQVLRHDEELAERLSVAVELLGDSVEIDPDVRSGLPVVRGTRVSISRILAELADDYRLSEISESLDIDVGLLKNILEGISIRLDRPFTE